MKTIRSIVVTIALLIPFAAVRAQGVTASTAINNVVTAYYGVKNALADDNNSAAQSKAKELFAHSRLITTVWEISSCYNSYQKLINGLYYLM